MDPLLKDALAFLRDAGIIGALVGAMIGGWRRWWVWGWQYDECCTERTMFKTRADELERLMLESQHRYSRAQQTHIGKDGC